MTDLITAEAGQWSMHISQVRVECKELKTWSNLINTFAIKYSAREDSTHYCRLGAVRYGTNIREPSKYEDAV